MTTEAIAEAAQSDDQNAIQASGTAVSAASTAGQTAASTPDVQPAATSSSASNAHAGAGVFGESVTYQPTGDTNLDLALAYIGKHGLGPEHPAIVAATKGDFGPVKALLAEKDVPGWEAHIALAEKGYADHVRAEAEKTVAIQNICVQAAGGEQEWADVLAWASENAEPQEKEQVNAALAQGGVVAEAMAAFLVNSYRGAPDVTYAPREHAVNQNAGRGAATVNGGPLSPRDYANAVADLRRIKGVSFTETFEYRQLQQRRAMYRS